MSNKLAIAIGSIVVVVGSAVGYRLITGQCPVGACMHWAHGDKAKVAATADVKP
jgi:hypothetical protein